MIRRFLHGRSILTATLYTVVGIMPLFLTTAQAPRLQAELGFGKAELGYLVAAFFLVSSVASRTLGPVVDRVGVSRGLRLAAALSLVSLVSAATVGSGWELLSVSLAVAGLANAFGQLASNRAVTDRVRDRRQGLGFGLKQAAVPVAASLAGLAVPLTADHRLLFGAAAALAALAWFLVPVYAVPAPAPADDLASASTAPLVLLAVAAALAGGVGHSLASFATDLGVTRGFSEQGAARLLTLGSLGSVGTRVLVGVIADRRQRGGRGEVLSLLGLATVGFLVLGSSPASEVVFVLAVVVGFVGGWGWPGVMYYWVARSSHLPAASSTGRVLAGAYVGPVVVPPLVGWVAERLGYDAVFLGAAAVMTLAGVAVAMGGSLLARQEAGRPVG